jgi:endonuclease/exonuclease/phosphatase (EEP) superfamily protein YafD
LIVARYKVAKRYFKFENMGLKAKGFVDRVRQWWTSYHFQGAPSYILARILKALKDNLRVWNEQVFDNVETNKKILLDELCVLNGSEDK